jgi:16S rRNA (guanine966-N2)-methyltransferase
VATLRVTAGTLRGRRVPVPRGELRPTSERARQAFFNIVGRRIAGSRFLDLFAGSGIFSFEAVSRGAASATAVDADRHHTEAIARRAEEWEVPVSTVTGELPAALPRLGRTAFDVVYADPPFDFRAYDELLGGIDRDVTLAGDAVVAIEHQRRTDPFTHDPRRLRRSRRAEYGEVWITFFTAPSFA